MMAVDISIGDAQAIEGSQATKFIDEFVESASGGLDIPRGLVFDADGDLYVASAANDAVYRYNGETGSLVGEFVASGSGGLDGPFDLKFGPDGNLYVSSFDGTSTVIRYDGATGAYMDTFIPAGAGGLTQPTGLLFAPDGDLLVSSYNAGEILEFGGPLTATPGQFVGALASTGTGSSPDFMTFGPDGNLYVGCPNHLVAPGSDAVVKRFDGSTGAFIDTFVPAGSGGIGDIRAVLFDVSGNLLVADTQQNAILRYQGPAGSSPGAFIDAMVTTGLGGLEVPIGAAFGADGNLYVASRDTDNVLRYGDESQAVFTVSLSAPSETPIAVDFSTASGSAAEGADYVAAAGTITFAPGETSRTIVVATLDDATLESTETFSVNLANSSAGATIADGQGIATIVDNEIPPTKFFVVDDTSANKTFEYGSTGAAIENYNLNSGNAAPRGAASTVAGDKVWVVDNNRKVFVYDTSGGLLGSWTAGTLANNAQPQGIATDGTDVWIVDAKSDKVFKYTGAASKLSGSQNAASSFNLASGNGAPTDIVTSGTHLWVVNDAANDKVFKYTVSGSSLGNWTLTGGGGAPTGITIDPSNVSDIWIVDSSTDRVYTYTGAASKTSGSQAAASSFALAAGNSNPQGIADPPVASGNIVERNSFRSSSPGSAEGKAEEKRNEFRFTGEQALAAAASGFGAILSPDRDQDLEETIALLALQMASVGR